MTPALTTKMAKKKKAGAGETATVTGEEADRGASRPALASRTAWEIARAAIRGPVRRKTTTLATKSQMRSRKIKNDSPHGSDDDITTTTVTTWVIPWWTKKRKTQKSRTIRTMIKWRG